MNPPGSAVRPAGAGVAAAASPAGVVGWSLALIGLCVFSATIVTTRLPLGVVGIGIALVGLLIERPKIVVPKPAVLYGLFLLWAFVGSFNAFEPELARTELLERFKIAVIFVVAVNALRTEAQVRFYVLLLLVCFVLYPVRGALQNYFFVHYTYFGRAIWNSGYANPNDLGALCVLAMGIALAIGFGPERRPWIRALTFFGVLGLTWVIFLTQSRGAFIGLVVGIGSGFARLAFRNLRNVLLAALALVLLAAVVPSKVFDRLSGISKLTSESTIREADSTGSAAERFEIQKTGLRIAFDHPWIGVGLGNYPIANDIYSPKLGSRDTHNTYLNLWAETGLPGLGLWLWFVVSSVRRFHRRTRAVVPEPGALNLVWIERGVIGVLVSGLFGSYSNLTLLYLLLGVLVCGGSLGAEGGGAGAGARAGAVLPAGHRPSRAGA